MQWQTQRLQVKHGLIVQLWVFIVGLIVGIDYGFDCGMDCDVFFAHLDDDKCWEKAKIAPGITREKLADQEHQQINA